MKTVFAEDLFNNKNNLSKLFYGKEKNIFLDFSKVDNVSINDIQKLLNMNKVAKLNNKNIQLKNVKTNICIFLNKSGIKKPIGQNITIFPNKFSIETKYEGESNIKFLIV